MDILKRILAIGKRLRSMCGRETFGIFKKAINTDIYSEATVVEVTNSNLEDVLDFNESYLLETFSNFLSQGDKGFYAYLENKCVHRSWVKFGPQRMQIFQNYSYDLGKDDIYIHYCATAEFARGKSVYPFVLQHICRKFPDKNVFLMALDRKKSARRGAEKAGFRKFLAVNYCYLWFLSNYRVNNLDDDFI